MANDFSGSDVVEYFKFEPGALVAGGKGTTLTNLNGVEEEVSDFKEGSGCAKFGALDRGLVINDADLPAGFPLKNGWTPSPFTLAWWFKATASTNTPTFLKKGTDQRIYIASSEIWWAMGGYSRPLFGVSLNVWHHFTFSYDPSTGVFYACLYNADAKSISTSFSKIRSGYNWTGNASQLEIGVNQSSNYYLTGLMDEFVALNRFLGYGDAQSLSEGRFPNGMESYRSDSLSQYTGNDNCVALYRFDAGARGLGRDSVGDNQMWPVESGRNGYLIQPYTADKKRGSSCAWFKESRYANRGDLDLSSNFPFKADNSNKRISIAIWFKALALDTEHNLVGKHQRATESNPEFYHYGFRLWTYNTELRADFQYGTYNQSTETKTLFSGLQTGRWYHLSFTYDTDAKTYYAELWDDTAGSETTAGPLTTTNTPGMPTGGFGVGGFAGLTDDSYYWNGYIDEVAIFNDILTAEEMQNIRDGAFSFATDDNCVALYDFEPGPSFLLDSKGGNHLGISGDPYSNPGLRREGLSCLNTSTSTYHIILRIDEADMEDDFPFLSTEANDEMSVGFWMRPTSLPGLDGYYRYICGKGDFYSVPSYQVCWALRFQRQNPNDTIVLQTGYNGGASLEYHTLYAAPGNLNLNRWYFVGLSINRTTGAYVFYLYDDETGAVLAEATGTLSNLPGLVDKPFAVGGVSYNDQVSTHPDWSLIGNLDEFSVWSKALSLAEFRALKDGAIPPPTEVRQSRADISGNARHLADNGTLQTGNTQGKIGNAAYFSGAGQQLLRLAEAPDLTGDAEFTVAFRMKPHLEADPVEDIYWHFKVGDLEIRAGFAPGQTKAFVSGSTPSLSCGTGNVIPADTFSFVAVYFDTSGLYIDVNDSNEASSIGGSTGIVMPASGIEAGISAAVEMNISIDELGLWVGLNALSEAQRTTLYSGNYGQRPSFS